jgi:putative heme-binding domain-containing protein
MMHTLVITEPGGLSEVGKAAEAMAAQPGGFERGFIPESDRILWATKLLQPGEAATLSFETPQQPGVYPFVCTYPGHWRRMFGAMHVVADLKAYDADPVAYSASHPLSIQDELLSDDRPLTVWTFEELEPSLASLAHGRSFLRAQRVFQFANCVACHQLDGKGQAVGPDLTKLDPNWSPSDVLRELLEPSKRINEKFQTYLFLLDSGKTVSGLIVEETEAHVKVLENPLARQEPTLLGKAEIEVREKSAISMMPQGLLDRLTADEILDLIAYVLARGDRQSELFQGGHHH